MRRAASVLLFGFALLLFLITFLMPREDGEVSEPGFLVLCYILPVIGMAAAARRAWPALAASASASGGWILIVFALW